MNKKVIAILISSILVLGALITSLFLIFNQNEPIKSEEAQKPAPSSTASPSPSASADNSPKAEPKTVEEYREIRNPDKVDAVSWFSEEDVENAVSFATDYAESSLGNKYFLSGAWADAGYPIESVVGASTPFYSKAMLDELENMDQSLTGEAYANIVMPYVFYVDNNGFISPSPYCADEVPTSEENADGEIKLIHGEVQCPNGVVEISDIKYTSVERNSDGAHILKMEYSAEAEIPVEINDTKETGTTNVKYDYVLFLEKENVTEEGETEFAIAAHDTRISISKVTPLGSGE